eukprot:gene11498-biopygen8348
MGVDVGIVQEACLRLDNQCQSANCDLWKAIKELRERLAKFRQVPSSITALNRLASRGIWERTRPGTPRSAVPTRGR